MIRVADDQGRIPAGPQDPVQLADFLAATQLLIYVGGILVLLLFGVMLTHKITNVKISNDATPGPAALCAVLCLLFSLGVAVGTVNAFLLERTRFAGQQALSLLMLAPLRRHGHRHLSVPSIR